MLNIPQLEKCKSKLQWGITSHWSERSSLKKSTNNNTGEGVEKSEPPSCSVGGNVNWYSHYGEQYGDSLKNEQWNYHMTQQSHYWPYILKKTLINKNTCMPVFIKALFTIARTWKQSRCLLTDEWIKKKWYIYTMEYYSALKRNTSESVVDKPRAYDTEHSKTERENQIWYTNPYIWNLERWY